MNKEFTVEQLKRMSYNKYLETDYWKGIRNSVCERDDNKCRLCNSNEKICVHHRTYEYIGEENLNELITLCNNCHYAFHKTHELNNKSDKKLRESNKLIEKFSNIVNKNIKEFEELNSQLKQDNYIYFTVFKNFILKYVRTENVSIQYKFLVYCLKCCNAVHLDNYFEDSIKKYNLPPKNIHGRTKEIIIKKQLYEHDPNNFRKIGYEIL